MTDWRNAGVKDWRENDVNDPEARSALCPTCGGTLYRRSSQRVEGSNYKMQRVVTVLDPDWYHTATHSTECPDRAMVVEAEPEVQYDVVPPTVGVDMRSKTMFYDPDGEISQPKGGLYLETVDRPGWTGDGEYVDGIQFEVVGVHHGQPRWHTIDLADVDWSSYTGLKRVDVVRDTIAVILRDAARKKGGQLGLHLSTMTRLEGALQ